MNRGVRLCNVQSRQVSFDGSVWSPDNQRTRVFQPRDIPFGGWSLFFHTLYADLKGPEEEMPSVWGLLWLLDIHARDRST